MDAVGYFSSDFLNFDLCSSFIAPCSSVLTDLMEKGCN